MSSELLLTTQADFQRGLLKQISLAQTKLQIEFYIFSPGEFGDLIVEELLKAAKRGVQIEILIDAIGSPEFETRYGSRLKMASISFRLFNRVNKAINRVFKGRLSITRVISILNRRNHRKIILRDGQEAIVGSFNIDDRNSPEIYGKDAWRDIAVQFVDADTPILSEAMRDLYRRRPFHWWRRRWTRCLINQGPGSSLQFNRILKKRLQEAQKRIWIQNPYFIPIRPVLDILIAQARRGIDIRVIVPRRNDIFFIRWLSYYYFRYLMKAGIQVFEYLPSFSHQKILQVDDRAFIGSINFNHRSFLHDREIEVEIFDLKNRALLETRFLEELQESRKLELPHLSELSFFERIMSRVFLLMRYFS